MERDLRRGQGEWKGCYTFQDTSIPSASDNRPAKIGNGGLKMGATYYYYVSSLAHPFTHHSFTFCSLLRLPFISITP